MKHIFKNVYKVDNTCKANVLKCITNVLNMY